jgi:hypothetical protein
MKITMNTITPINCPFLPLLQDDHPARNYNSYLQLLAKLFNHEIIGVDISDFFAYLVGEWPLEEEFIDQWNLTIPFRDFEMEYKKFYMNIQDVVVIGNDNYRIIIDEVLAQKLYENYQRNVNYYMELIRFVFRNYSIESFGYPNHIVAHLISVRNAFVDTHHPLLIVEMEVRMLEHFAMFPNNVEYLITLWEDRTDFFMPITHAVDSDRHAWKFPLYLPYLRNPSPETITELLDDYSFDSSCDKGDEYGYTSDTFSVNSDWGYDFNTDLCACESPYTSICSRTHLEWILEYDFECDTLEFYNKFWENATFIKIDCFVDDLLSDAEFMSIFSKLSGLSLNELSVVYTNEIKVVPQMYLPGISDVTESLGSVKISMDNLADKLPDHSERMDWQKVFRGIGTSLEGTSSVFSAFSNFSNSIPGMDKAKQTAAKLQEAVSNVSKSEQNDTLFVCMLSALLYYIKYRTWTGLSLFTVFWIPLCFVENKVFKYTCPIWLYISCNMPLSIDVDEEIAEPQIDVDSFESVVELIASIFLGYFSFGKCKEVSSSILLFLKDFGKVKGGAVDVAKAVFKLLENCINKTIEWIRGTNPMFRFFSMNNQIYDEYFKEVREFCSKYNNHQVVASPETLSTVAALIDTGRKIKLGLPKDPTSKEISEFIKLDLLSLTKIQNSLEHQNISFTGFRQEPVVIEFKGPTSVAKSVVQTNANYAAVARHFSGSELESFKRQPSTKVYTCVPENEYMDGFKQHHWVVNIDDFGQSRDIVGNPDNEYMKFVRFVNGFEYYPHMAELANKGTVTFKAPYIVISTNIRKHNPVSLHCPAAFRRRIHFSYIVVPKDEYCTPESLLLDLWHRVLDKKSLPIDPLTKQTVIDDRIHDFYCLDPETSDMTGEVISFSEVMSRWFAEYDKKKQYFEQNLNTFNKTIDKYHTIFHPEIEVADDNSCEEEIIMESPITPVVYSSFQDTIRLYLTHSRARSLITHHCPGIDYDPLNLVTCLPALEDALLKVGIDEKIFKSKLFELKPIVPIYKKVKFRTKTSIMERINLFLVEYAPALIRFKNFIVGNGPVLVFAFMTFIVGTAIGNCIRKLLIKMFCSREEYDEIYPQSHNEGDKMRKLKESQKLYRSSKIMKEFIRNNPSTAPQMGSDSNGQDILHSIIRSNHFTLAKENSTVVDGTAVTTWDHLGHFVVWRDRVAQMPYHYIISMSNGLQDDPTRLDVKLKLIRNGKSKSPVEYIITVRDILANFDTPNSDNCILHKLLKKDQVLVRLPDKVQPCRDITEYIISSKNLSKDASTIEALVLNGKSSFFCWANYKDSPCPVIDDKNNESWMLRDYYRYHAVTVNGDCGSLFGKMDASIQKQKIYGMHVSGAIGANFGYAVSFTQEEILEALNAFHPQEYPIEPQIEWLDDMNFVIDGPIANPPILPTKSSIIKSPIFDVVKKHSTIPCKLFKFVKDGQEIDPWEKALSKYSKELPELSEVLQDQIERASHAYFNMVHDTMIVRSKPRVFTLTEAIHGIPDDPWFGPIPSNTSAGYPMNVQGTDNLKKMLFASDRNSPEYMEIFERIAEDVELAEVTYATGGRPEFFYVDYLKDERKPIDKARMGKTRMFSGGPLVLFILFRKHFGWFDSHFKSNKIQNWSAIGVNPYSEEWDHIAKYLGEVTIDEVRAGAGDYAGFDTAHLPFVHGIMVMLIIKVYYPNATKREIAIKMGLFLEIFNSNHIFLGIIVRWFQGMPSGNALTAIINTIYNAICLCFVFMVIKDENPSLNLRDEDCTKMLRAIILGDDNVFSTSPLLVPYYNELTLPDILKRIGMTYTTELKLTAIVPNRPITEVSFLKRAWLYDDLSGRYIAPLELDVILEFSMWTRKGKDYMNIACSNFENTLNELSLHPKEIWDKYYPTLLSAAKQEYTQYPWVLPLLTPHDVRRQRTLQSISFY